MSNEVTIKCQWCGGEFKIPKATLQGTSMNPIQMCFYQPFQTRTKKGVWIRGVVELKVSPKDCDICETCALVFAEGAVGDLKNG